MLHNTISDFLSNCKTYGFGVRSLEVFSSKLNKFAEHLNSLRIYSIREISYNHLLSFIISGNPSIYTKKQRVWSLYQFFQYLKNMKIIKNNIVSKYHFQRSITRNQRFSLLKS